MAEITLTIPDIGSDNAEVVEILVAVGDDIVEDQSLLVLESDKASMEVPAAAAGRVVSLLVKVGDEVSEGSDVLTLEGDANAEGSLPAAPAETAEPESEQPIESEPAPSVAVAEAASTVESSSVTLSVPDIGGDSAEVVEVLISVGDAVTEEQSLIVLESDKASMEVPAITGGEVVAVNVRVGDTLSEGDAIAQLQVAGQVAATATASSLAEETASSAASESVRSEPMVAAPAIPGAAKPTATAGVTETTDAERSIYAGPAVRKLAREFGIDLTRVSGSGPRGRIVKQDLHDFVSRELSTQPSATGIEPIPDIDFAQFGSIDPQPRSRLDKLTAANMTRAWLNVPHVTQFDDADITELEAFRKSLKVEAERRGAKLSPLPFILKACAVALNANPRLKSSLAEGGETLVFKNYCHIGMAVDTPAGLMVPVLRDVDQKSVWQLAEEIIELAGLARDRKLRPEQMQGGVFSVSSLGSIGGRGFTPIVNTPEVAILGVSRASVQPVWVSDAFVPRTLLPLSLSYDHRVINGGDAGRFLTQLVGLLGDIRRCLL